MELALAGEKEELARFAAGRAPQGIAIAPDGNTAYVHNFMDRSVSVHDVSGIVHRGELDASAIRTIEKRGGLDAFLLSTPAAKLGKKARVLKRRIAKAGGKPEAKAAEAAGMARIDVSSL